MVGQQTLDLLIQVRILVGQHFGKFIVSLSNCSVQAKLKMKIEFWYVYMLLCDEKTFYIGISNDVVYRLDQHKNKQSFFTKKFSYIKLVYCEKYANKFEAAKREKQLKGWSNAKKRLLISGKFGINKCTEFDEALSKPE